MLVKNKKSLTIYLTVLAAILLLLNLISRNWYKRFDLTDNKMYSLSKSSEDIVDKIDDLLTMKVYFSDDLPGELSNTKRYLQDLLEEYEAKSDNIRFFFTDPESNEKLQEEARKDGIQPVQMQVVENDKLEIKRVYLGMVILYEDKKETIPVIQTATGLEYLITTKIKTLVNTNKKTIGIANLSTTAEDIKTETISNQLKQHHTVRNVDLSNEGLIIDNIDVLLISGATDTVDSSTISNISRFVETGKSIFIAQGGVSTDMQTQQATSINSNIFSLLKTYGLIVNQNLVLDKSCGRVQVQQQMGFIRMNVPMEYPFLPIIRNFNEEELVVSGLEQIHMFFPSEIKLDTLLDKNVIGVTDLLSSSDKSGVIFTNDGSSNTVINSNFGVCKTVVEGWECDELLVSKKGIILNKEYPKIKESLIKTKFCQFNTRSDSEILLKLFAYELYKTNFEKVGVNQSRVSICF